MPSCILPTTNPELKQTHFLSAIYFYFTAINSYLTSFCRGVLWANAFMSRRVTNKLTKNDPVFLMSCLFLSSASLWCWAMLPVRYLRMVHDNHIKEFLNTIPINSSTNKNQNFPELPLYRKLWKVGSEILLAWQVPRSFFCWTTWRICVNNCPGGLEQSLHTVILYKCFTKEYINVSKPETNNSIRPDHTQGLDQTEAHSALVCAVSLPFPPE